MPEQRCVSIESHMTSWLKIAVVMMLCTILFISACARSPIGIRRSVDLNNTNMLLPEQRTLHVASSHPEELLNALIKEFEDLSGIWVELTAAGTMDLFQELKRWEMSGGDGVPPFDLVFGGGIDTFAKNIDYFTEYESSMLELVDSNLIPEHHRWSPFTRLATVLVYNNKSLPNTDIPETWAELLEPRWEGRIAFGHPAVSASAQTQLATVIAAVGRDNVESTVEAFERNVADGLQISSGDVISSVAEGLFPLGITLEDNAIRAMRAGTDLDIVYPEDGLTLLPDAMGIVHGSEYEEEAKEFIDFMLRSETQAMVMKEFARRSVLNDALTPSGLLNLEDLLTFSLDEEVLSIDVSSFLNEGFLVEDDTP